MLHHKGFNNFMSELYQATTQSGYAQKAIKSREETIERVEAEKNDIIMRAVNAEGVVENLRVQLASVTAAGGTGATQPDTQATAYDQNFLVKYGETFRDKRLQIAQAHVAEVREHAKLELEQITSENTSLVAAVEELQTQVTYWQNQATDDNL